jgi:hypothetical protein
VQGAAEPPHPLVANLVSDQPEHRDIPQRAPVLRRHLDERQSTPTIGFRCAMTRVGSPVGLGDEKRRTKLNK